MAVRLLRPLRSNACEELKKLPLMRQLFCASARQGGDKYARKRTGEGIENRHFLCYYLFCIEKDEFT